MAILNAVLGLLEDVAGYTLNGVTVDSLAGVVLVIVVAGWVFNKFKGEAEKLTK